MQEGSTEYDSTEYEGLNSLREMLRQPKFRREFHESPKDALERAGIDASKIDEDFMWALSELSYAELRLVVDVVGRIRDISPVAFPF